MWAAGRLLCHLTCSIRRPPRARTTGMATIWGGTGTRTNGEPTGQVAAGAVPPFVIMPLPYAAPNVKLPNVLSCLRRSSEQTYTHV